MGTTYTPRLALPRPDLDGSADGPDGFEDLSDSLDPRTVIFASGTLAARPAAGIAGRFYWATDAKVLAYDDGTAWNTQAAAAAITASGLPVLDVGLQNQIRAGRQLTVADFTSLGLSAPLGLWNLSNLTNLGSDGRALSNKGAVPFGVGINGLASTAAVFSGSASQALYIPDSGAADPYRIRTGSWGCWLRTAKRGVTQCALAKWADTGNQRGWLIQVDATGLAFVRISTTGADFPGGGGVSDVADDRWHWIVVSFDGTALRLYVDGVLETAIAQAGTLFATAAPLNVGAQAADAGTAAGAPFYGRTDEAFVTADIPTEDQMRCLYAAKLPHTLGVAPSDVRLNVHRRRRGAELAVSDFPTQPLRLYNFTSGAMTDQGSNGVTLNAGAAYYAAGADGSVQGARGFNGTGSDNGTDVGLPSGLAARSYGAWFKTTTVATAGILGWGNGASSAAGAWLGTNTAGAISNQNGGDLAVGSFVADGQWHFAVVTEDNAAGDGVRRKLYLDGRLVVGSTVLNTLTLGGANRFRLGGCPDNTSLMTGQIDTAFVCGYALDAPDIGRLYAKGAQDLGVSPKNPGDHVERVDATGVLFIGDTLEPQHMIDLGVAA